MAKIDITRVSENYLSTRIDAGIIGEKNDCAVVAVHVATGVPYRDVLELMKKHGRESRKGTYTRITLAVLEELGFKAVCIKPREFTSLYPGVHKNLKHVTSHHMRRFPEAWADGKTYLLQNRNHIWCVKNGVNHDWSVNRVLRATLIYRVEPNQGDEQ